jgi:hypothetical protein
MPGPGSHVVYARGADLVVEWYDFGDGALYEFVKLMIFGPSAQAQLAAALDAPKARPSALAPRVAAHFTSFFEVEKFAEQNGIPFVVERCFDP